MTRKGKSIEITPFVQSEDTFLTKSLNLSNQTTTSRNLENGLTTPTDKFFQSTKRCHTLEIYSLLLCPSDIIKYKYLE